MINLQTTDNNLVGIAIGEEDGYWYVQTTDIGIHTHLSEIIAENVSKEDAVKLAKQYGDMYGFKIVIWSNVAVYHDEYGYGVVAGNDLSEDYPIFIEFEDERLDELDLSGYFKFEQIKLI